MTGARISAVDVVIADIPAVRPHVLAMTTVSIQTVVLVFVQRSDGIVGVGEATTIGGLAYGEESPEGVQLVVEHYLKPLILGEDGDRPASVMAKIDRQVVGNRFARCAIETALLDAFGQSCGLPISELLGGRRQDDLPVAWTLATGDVDRDVAEGEQLLAARRHNIFKLKVGRRALDDDCKHAAAVARAFEGRASVRIDVNQRWSRSQANRALPQLRDAGIALVEQPLDRNDLDGARQLASQGVVPIMADEALSGPRSAWQLARTAGADAFSLKICQSGGVRPAKHVAALADASGIGLYGGTMLESGVGTAASAQLCATLPALEWGTELFGPLLLAEGILEEPLQYRDFKLVVPSAPGIGVRVDRERIRHFQREGTR
jgi:muconate cycloisomerase